MKYRLPVLFCFLLSIIPFFSKAQWDDKDRLPASFHKAKREALRALLPEKSVAVFFANPERNRANDVDFQYSQDPAFYYLTGYLEPNSLLLIFKEPRNIDGKQVNEILFVQERDAKKETWNGKRLGVEGVKKMLGFDAAYNGREFREFGIDFAKFNQIEVIYPTSPFNDKKDSADLADLVDQFKEKTAGYIDKVESSKLVQSMASLREIKSPEELKLMQKAIDVSIDGFKEMMRSMKPGLHEYEAQAMVEYFMRKGGSEYNAYGSIAGSGNNGCVLHYTFNRAVAVDGDLLLSDMGAEYHGYAADITRTFPVNGKFSPNQKQLYELVLKAQNEGIKVCVAGNGFRAAHEACVKIITAGLMELGIIKAEADYRKYFMHGTSHYLGLDVHDAGTMGALKAGNVITVEPGIYIAKGSDCDPKWWNIGIRIEDDILITDGEPVNLSGALPRQVADIELLMTEKGFFEK